MSDDRRYRDESWLREQYVDHRKTIPEIAEMCDCSISTVHTWLGKNDIETRGLSGVDKDADHRDESYLREKYLDEGMSVYEIADDCDVTNATICNWLSKHGIETRVRTTKPEKSAPDERLTDAGWLGEKYTEQQMSAPAIADICDCSTNAVYGWLVRHDIETRSSGRTFADERLTDAEWLREQYHKKDLRCQEIAEKCGCHASTVSDWLQNHDIETFGRNPVGADHPHWNGGPAEYGPGWTESKRRTVRKRDGHVCRDASCSVTQEEHLDKYGQKLHVHHLRKARDVDDPELRNATGNLITLCRDCHREWEKIADAGLVPEVPADD